MSSRSSRASAAVNVPPVITGLGAVIDRYDAFILDLWGCVHDGLHPYPDAPDALKRLKAAGKRVLLLSNAPRRAQTVREHLAQHFGIGSELYDDVLTSGETAYQALMRRDDPAHAALGKKVLYFGPARDLSMVEGNGLVRVDDVEQADFMFSTGVEDDLIGVGPHEADLRIAAERGLALICANPDLEVMRGEERLVCAGALAQRYEELGGSVIYHGKPHAVTYRAAFRLLGNPEPARVLGVGDGMRTDVAGAANAGIHGAFIPGGIHAEELGIRMGEAPAPQATSALLAQFDAAPTYILPALRW